MNNEMYVTAPDAESLASVLAYDHAVSTDGLHLIDVTTAMHLTHMIYENPDRGRHFRNPVFRVPLPWRLSASPKTYTL
jgi:hypothetical protein